MYKLNALICLSLILFSACSDDDNGPSVTAPDTFTFERDGQSSVSFSGQTTRILMGEELISAMKDFESSTLELLEMYKNETADGGDANPFGNEDLNGSDKSIRSKTAASRDFFSANTIEASQIKEDFEQWIEKQVGEVFPNELTVAAPGTAGQIADGSSTRFVNANGLEYNQLVNKSLIGALMLDQALNNYLGTAVLDEADNRSENDADIVADGKNYTTMEHKWDEAYGYLYGTSASTANPNATIGEDDSFLNKYVGRVENDADFTGIADDIFNAFKLGRAAIVAKDYTLRDQQADIIKEKLSEVIAIRAVYYLQQGKMALPDDRNNTAAYGTTFHDLSEGYGFIYSLRFTRRPGSDAPYFTKAEVDGFLEDLLGDGQNGLWDVTDATLDALSEAIAAKFNFTVEQAGES
ncbi:DUF4856 domain-containing protein [Fulvivirga sp. M361]|uniref:DUF4856 domain-containing protein n=1 Tax=Fulvivirga sp. M361 TaxID=2594266 RepID=UPI00117A05C3|nr:DUF4856 domain-containing protein [Fulvivirga sp. M361]TRX48492.1 DUF4856 domain-containing protein [Fulvivirga sp. M361]